ncbi:similar to Saccharomyces cerevisiae YPL001W HAT1 Catalytic subunit of the Hat1p-Hat2p histone acetyltransferase complex that uses the cofactor acetyl coenzyme A [Maudiozyma saulgeensis]|uniref:Histone acetyltransferase type B catalytic subunit n=1 Tax=Maudiozyma saulgeensis TaxID=1789683 RepID=A0A1X7R1H8_9SACH|nr:similar to Saccharomyces cerevisiae YPL001W HAT1 Catalytic subunit of the Hat1p-Hat2p histone acetyltransferase complex that uses the cofactor acetyl coenzyme A [Kazachstania saulgeensis]
MESNSVANASDFQPQSWQISSNEALKISLIEKDTEAGAIQFSPLYTYPIFGDEEMIYGYKDLVIHLVFDSITYKPFLNVKYSEKLNDDINPEKDIINKIIPFLPKDDYILKDELKWVDSFTQERKNFNIMSSFEKIDEYTKDSNKFGIYRVPIGEIIQTNKESSIVKFWERIQIFTLLFIEAATYLNLQEEPRWVIYLIFNEQDKNLIGFATTYSYWDYQGFQNFDKTSSNIQFNEKISQFLIIPPYQGKGHGSTLYQSLYSYWNKQSNVSCITVEDPNEQFDDLRDYNDLKILQENKFFQDLIEYCSKDKDDKNFFINEEWIETQRHKYKFEKRQFQRLIEMILLVENKTMINLFKRQVKRRIWIKNYDSLFEIEDEDQKFKAIDDSYLLVKQDYERILKTCKYID